MRPSAMEWVLRDDRNEPEDRGAADWTRRDEARRQAPDGPRRRRPPPRPPRRDRPPVRRLVIVESPTKAKKIAPYLGTDYVVESSVGHIRDLPRGAADVPAKYKGESWARLGVDVDNQFRPSTS